MKPQVIALINPQYPFDKNRIFLGGAIVSVAARLMAMGHTVGLVDLNLEHISKYSDESKTWDFTGLRKMEKADVIGIALTGSSDIPGALSLAQRLQHVFENVPIMIGGQIIEHLEPDQFCRVFGTYPKQIRDDHDLARVLGCAATDIPKADEVSYTPVYREMGEERLVTYLRAEMALVISQGCHFHCHFCAAQKGIPERFRNPRVFEADLGYLAEVGARHGVQSLTFYATNLDFFQNPQTLRLYLEAVARVWRGYAMPIRIRCLSRFDSFLSAARELPHLQEMLGQSGVRCIGFGADGADPAIWKAQGKGNKISDMLQSLVLCKKWDIGAELLMVLGFPEDTARTLLKAVIASWISVLRWRHVVIRPYLAKEVVPGNDGWKRKPAIAEHITAQPRLFYNLDFCAIGSAITHPRPLHRWLCNAAYLLIYGSLAPFGKCLTSPLLPQGEEGWGYESPHYGRFARWVNRQMSFDK